jgi:hypothetical protein
MYCAIWSICALWVEMIQFTIRIGTRAGPRFAQANHAYWAIHPVAGWGSQFFPFPALVR